MFLYKKIFIFLAFLILTASLSLPGLVKADVYDDARTNLKPFEDVLGQPKDPRLIVMGIVEVFLGFLGILFLSYIVYAGYLWMTAGGNDEKVAKAKSIIRNSIIGLAIIVSAYGITRMVICNLIVATTDDWSWSC